jgi:hypothetical protein
MARRNMSWKLLWVKTSRRGAVREKERDDGGGGGVQEREIRGWI